MTCRKKHPKSIKRKFSRDSRRWRSKGKKKLWNSCKRSTRSSSSKATRERGRMLQRFGGPRAIKHWNDARDIMSVESWSPSMACDMEEVCSESSTKMQDKEETTSEASWNAVTKGKEKEVRRLEPEGEAERPEPTVPWNGVNFSNLFHPSFSLLLIPFSYPDSFCPLLRGQSREDLPPPEDQKPP